MTVKVHMLLCWTWIINIQLSFFSYGILAIMLIASPYHLHVMHIYCSAALIITSFTKTALRRQVIQTSVFKYM